MAKVFAREIDISAGDMNSETLPIRSLGEMVSAGVLTPEEMSDVLVRRQSLDFTVNHAGDGHPMTWTLTPADEPNQRCFFTGWKDFRQMNGIDGECTLVFIRHPGNSERTLTLVGGEAPQESAERRDFLLRVLTDPDKEIKVVRRMQRLQQTLGDNTGGGGEAGNEQENATPEESAEEEAVIASADSDPTSDAATTGEVGEDRGGDDSKRQPSPTSDDAKEPPQKKRKDDAGPSN